MSSNRFLAPVFRQYLRCIYRGWRSASSQIKTWLNAVLKLPGEIEIDAEAVFECIRKKQDTHGGAKRRLEFEYAIEVPCVLFKASEFSSIFIES